MLKKFFLIAGGLILSYITQAQLAETKVQKRDVFLLTGFKVVPIDWLAGPSIGVSWFSPDKALSVEIRRDYLISIGQQTADNNGVIVPIQEKMEITQFFRQSSLYLNYRIQVPRMKWISLGIGLSSTNMGDRENLIFSSDYSYHAISATIQFPISWFVLELKGDYEFKNDYYYSNLLRITPIPFSVGILYRFHPKFSSY